MGVEYFLIDHQHRVYYEIGKGLGAAGVFGKWTADQSKYLPCGARPVNRYEDATDLVTAFVEESGQPELGGYPWLWEVAEEILVFLREHETVCLHDDSGYDMPDDYHCAGSRYRNGGPMR